MRSLSVVAVATVSLLFASSTLEAACDRIPGCELVWADEFDGNEVDADKWVFQRGDGSEVGLPSGWGNNELQWYREENATVAKGSLIITARRESVSGAQYTSARLRTAGLADWRYGRMEMRAKLPVGQGLWPAFWMLPTEEAYGGWAASGEIDIMESVGQEPERVLGTIHYGAPWPNNSFTGDGYELPRDTFADGFHVFAIEWEPAEIRWYVDDVNYATQSDWFSSNGPYPAPFDQRFHLLLNVAVGGNLPGPPNDSTEFPQEMVVDYVRVYQATAAKGTQVTSASLAYDKAPRMKKIEAGLSIPFENQALKRDQATDRRSLSCTLRARGARKALTVKGRLLLELQGDAGGEAWSGSTANTSFDRFGQASFSADVIQELFDEASGAKASVERFRVSFDGSGGKKVKRLDFDCWQTSARD